jgi:hypothetical protein
LNAFSLWIIKQQSHSFRALKKNPEKTQESIQNQAVHGSTTKFGTGQGRCMATKSATPWGPATVLEEVKVSQRADGETLVRFAYTTGGAARRGPVTLRERDIDRLKLALGKHPTLAQALGYPVADA